MRELDLLPRPRHLERSGIGAALGSEPEVVRDPGLPAQGYLLQSGPESVRVRAADEAGERYARALLAQLAAHASDGHLPGVRVRDWPDFPVRGFMLDVSRDRVPTRETLARLVDLLALLRINHLEL